MKIVIDIPDNETLIGWYTRSDGINKYHDAKTLGEPNYIPLPKGHGRILDEKDILDTKNNDGGWYDLVDMPEYIAGVKAIIEADKEEINEGPC